MPVADHTVASVAALEALYGPVGEASRRKEIDRIHPFYRALIDASPFVVLATSGPGGLDASPRGDPAGFVVVADERTLWLPDRRGNNRIDSLRNLVVDPRIALLFLIPGAGETLRVNGRARLSTEPELLERCAMHDRRPQLVIVVTVETVYFQCARAIRRSRLWDGEAMTRRAPLPTAGMILEALTDGSIEATGYDRELPERQRSSLY